MYVNWYVENFINLNFIRVDEGASTDSIMIPKPGNKKGTDTLEPPMGLLYVLTPLGFKSEFRAV